MMSNSNMDLRKLSIRQLSTRSWSELRDVIPFWKILKISIVVVSIISLHVIFIFELNIQISNGSWLMELISLACTQWEFFSRKEIFCVFDQNIPYVYFHILLRRNLFTFKLNANSIFYFWEMSTIYFYV